MEPNVWLTPYTPTGTMASTSDHTHHIKLRETQLEMGADTYADAHSEDFEGKLQEAQQQLEHLQHQREELERQKLELEDLNRKKLDFVNGQIEMGERLSTSLTSIDRELFELRQELEDLEQTRQSFAAHLDRLENIEPESWPRETLAHELSRALAMLDQSEEEFEGAVAHFSSGRSRGIFGNGGSSRATAKKAADNGFLQTLKNGLAFNLPVVILGTIALLVYLVK